VISEKKAGCHLEFLPGKEAETKDRTQGKKNTTKNKPTWNKSHLD